MTGEETFEFAAAIAGVSIGLAAALLLTALAVIGTWRLFRHASEASQAAARAAASVEDLARHLSAQPPPAQAGTPELHSQLAALTESQQRLEDAARRLVEASAAGPPGVLDDVESSISRLDTTVGQMAASLTNLIQLLERQQERR